MTNESSAMKFGKLHRHARPYAGHPRLYDLGEVETWIAGPSPAMTVISDFV
jgi:hypothetical protein